MTAAPVEISHRSITVNGLRTHVAEAGSGPLVVLLHGWPESWYAWRHQLPALAAAGYHAVAPDQRGYGGTDVPERVEDYTIVHLVDDVAALIEALGERQAVVVGHDWGAIVAWNTAQMRPERVRGVAALSIPHRWAEPTGSLPPVAGMRAAFGEDFYIVHFQRPGVADADLARDPAALFRRMLGYTGPAWTGMLSPGGGLLDSLPEPDVLPDWLTERDIAAFAAEFERSGFTGGLNWYRNMDRNWELSAGWRETPVAAPALFVVGDRDGSYASPEARELIEGRSAAVPRLHGALVLPDCGHWTQQERPAEVNAALIDFLRSLEGGRAAGEPASG
ncbi:alpha/beta fold hydrolase [Allostreptomyces psammosilenae]|uniref:Pimeloyl-ACP methyl ester carboxylesterase n=1 Tax=Allostreptomyces psammosilenae TaxID=1892865 RepID=A0A852ZXD0_9ACTN|nr:alpha/beta hydrolase [Allostreptomyces psammosilenae]NYI07006.1 pimeloyl-ACP methyl ester carboxylesterase [Allostreptomyces psammosilenae]